MPLMLNLLALIFFLLGIAIMARVPRAEPSERPRYLRAAVGAMAAGAGNACVLKSPQLGLLFFLAAVVMVFSSRRV